MSAEARWLGASLAMLAIGMLWESNATALSFGMGAFACWLMSFHDTDTCPECGRGGEVGRL